jgi:hypothetical protein
MRCRRAQQSLVRQSYSRRQIDDLRHEINDLQSLQRSNRRLIAATETFANLSLVPVQQTGTYIRSGKEVIWVLMGGSHTTTQITRTCETTESATDVAYIIIR